MRKRINFVKAGALLLLVSVLFGGCDKRQDTRGYIETIGVVITNELDNVVKEMYIFPDTIADMGPDVLKNTKNMCI